MSPPFGVNKLKIIYAHSIFDFKHSYEKSEMENLNLHNMSNISFKVMFNQTKEYIVMN